MNQILLVSFSEDMAMLTALHQMLPSSLDFWTVPFHRRAEVFRTKENFIIIIVTLSMNNTQGLNQLSVLKIEYPHVPVIVVAKIPEQDDIITAFKLGADDVLIFPFDNIKLTESIRQITQQRKHLGFPVLQKLLSNFFNFFKTKQQHSPVALPFCETDEAPASQNSTVAIATMLPFSVLNPCAEQVEPTLQIKFFGKFQVFWKGLELKKMPSKKERSLLAYLMFYHLRCNSKDQLMTCFWPDSTPTSAKNCLNVTMHKARKCLQEFLEHHEVIIIYQDDCYSINPAIELEVDVDQFVRLWNEGRSLEKHKPEAMLDCYQKAIDLYKGDFMEQMLYEEWMEAERSKLKENYLHMLHVLCNHHFQNNNKSTVIQLANIMLEKDHCLEEIHRLLMKCYISEGQHDKAIRQYHKCQEILKKELNVQPSEATSNLFATMIR